MITVNVSFSNKAKMIEVRDYQEASIAYCQHRDAGAYASSQMGTGSGDIIKDGNKIGRVSYNGRIWDLSEKEIKVIQNPHQ